MKNSTLVFKESDYKALKKHLFPGNNLEFAAILLCHYGQGRTGFRLMVKELIFIPPDKCAEQKPHYLSWAFAEYMTPEKIEEVDKQGLPIITIHSHPNGYNRFSITDDENDTKMFHSINNWFDDGRPNGSAIMLPNGEVIARTIDNNRKFTFIKKAAVIGENIKIQQKSNPEDEVSDYGLKVLQTFGKGTFRLLRGLKAGVVGCSGTGSIIVELLTRNCVGHLTLIDPDTVEEKNLNRIINAKKSDAEKNLHKVEVIKKAIQATGLNTKVDAYTKNTGNKEVVEALTDCDVIFGCVDSAIGRYHLECVATAYFIPYFDIGVYLEADSRGGISQADVAAHYIHPENSSLMARGVYTAKQLSSEGWKQSNRDYYEKNKQAGYLQTVGEDQPAVISVNMQGACLAFNDFLARLHGFRLDDNIQFGAQKFQLVQGVYLNQNVKKEGPAPVFKKYLGMGERSFLIQNLKKGEKNHS